MYVYCMFFFLFPKVPSFANLSNYITGYYFDQDDWFSPELSCWSLSTRSSSLVNLSGILDHFLFKFKFQFSPFLLFLQKYFHLKLQVMSENRQARSQVFWAVNQIKLNTYSHLFTGENIMQCGFNITGYLQLLLYMLHRLNKNLCILIIVGDYENCEWGTWLKN